MNSTVRLLLTALVAAVIGGLVVWVATRGREAHLQQRPASDQGRVQCFFSKNDMLCTIERISGVRGSNVCWNVRAQCQNGSRVDWHGCGPVPPKAGGVETVRFPISEVPGLASCDGVFSSSVSDARVQ